MVNEPARQREVVLKRWLNLEDDLNVIRAEAQEIAAEIDNHPECSSVSFSFNGECEYDSSISLCQMPTPICESTIIQEESYSISPELEMEIEPGLHQSIQSVLQFYHMALNAAKESGNQYLIDVTSETFNNLNRELQSRFFQFK